MLISDGERMVERYVPMVVRAPEVAREVPPEIIAGKYMVVISNLLI
jgi:hypothetical protein